MVQSVELLLDRDGDRAVRSDWAALAAIGLRTPARHAGDATRPHVTLAVAERFPADVEEALARLRPAFPMPLVVGGLVVFGQHRRMILARGVAPSRALLEIQQQVADTVLPAGPVDDTMRPDRWTPHVTLAKGVDPAGLARATQALSDRRVHAAAVAVRRWDGTGRREWILHGQPP